MASFSESQVIAFESTHPSEGSPVDITLAESVGWIYYLMIALSAFLGCFLVAIGLPGQFFPGLVAAILWLTGVTGDDGDAIAGGTQVLILVGLALLAEGFEFASGLIGGKAAGSRWRGAIGGMIGGFGGAIFGNLLFPLLGGLVGIVIGTFAGAVFGELQGTEAAETDQAVRVGLASAVGKAVGLVAKVALNFGIGFWAILQMI